MKTASFLLRRTTAAALLILCLLATTALPNCHPPPPRPHPGGGKIRKAGGETCKECVVEELQYGCRKCTPILRCLARCMWGGAAKLKCIEKCDCGGGKPTLSDCKACMSRCKCSCMSNLNT
ncbi:hypothetical protein LINPERPRIM_LOCUS10297 [Linum perenne]